MAKPIKRKLIARSQGNGIVLEPGHLSVPPSTFLDRKVRRLHDRWTLLEMSNRSSANPESVLPRSAGKRSASSKIFKRTGGEIAEMTLRPALCNGDDRGVIIEQVDVIDGDVVGRVDRSSATRVEAACR